MSAGAPGGRKELCSYFVNGACRYGDSCRKSHDLASGTLPTVCKYYLMGACSYGSSCWYDHVTPDGTQRAAGAAAATASTAIASAALSMPPSSSSESEAVRTLRPLRKEFLSYADVAKLADRRADDDEKTKFDLCPLAETGRCSDPESCGYMHGLICDMCNLAVLQPFDEVQRQAHHEMCLAAHERSMERAFAAQQSADKQCTICGDTVVDKGKPSERRFGILSSCSHVFCLACIRTWRASKDDKLHKEAIRGCPECHVVSHYVVPSEFWVETADEKEKLVADYKRSLKKKHCMYFARGSGECLLGTSCFYLHANPDGTEAPAVYHLPRRRYNQDAELE